MKNVPFAKGTFLSRKECSFRYIVIPVPIKEDFMSNNNMLSELFYFVKIKEVKA